MAALVFILSSRLVASSLGVLPLFDRCLVVAVQSLRGSDDTPKAHRQRTVPLSLFALTTHRATLSVHTDNAPAVKHLKEIIKKAKPLDGKGLQVDVTHGNTQTKNGYIKTIIVYHNFTNLTVDYLNFWVKLTIGVTTSGKHIQYAVNKIELT